MNIIDCTLREGLQTPYFNLQMDAVRNFVKKLELSGVAMIECSHPHISDSYATLLKIVVNLGLNIPVLTHCRANKKDIDSALDCNVEWIGIFIGVNDISINSKYNGNKDFATDSLKESLRYAKERGLKIRVTIEDASRTSDERLFTAFQLAIDNGADRICYADTLGVLTPKRTAAIVKKIKSKFQQCPLEVHFHNDRGFALSNSYVAFENGADWISTSILGIGERSGICDTFQLMANISVDNDSPFPSQEVEELERLVSTFSQYDYRFTRPFTGKNAFVHSSKLHKLAMINDEQSYLSLEPEKFGNESTFAFNPSFEEYSIQNYSTKPIIRSAAELKYHTKGPGTRYIFLNDELIPGVNQYMIIRELNYCEAPTPHVDLHVHDVDSFYVFLGGEEDFKGLTVQVFMGDSVEEFTSPVTVYIPSGIKHKYEIVKGSGYYINHVSKGDYNKSIVEYGKFEVESLG